MDFGRRCYTTTARPFRNSDQEVTVRWYPADVSKGPLPFPSKICSIDWMGEKHTKEGVGEIWNRPRPFRPDFHPPIIDGDHICGTEDEFRNGEVLDLSRPLMKRSPSGIPLCCDPTRREADVKLSIIINSSYTPEREYRSPIRMAIVINSRTVRSDPYTSQMRVAFTLTSISQRSDPYRSRLLLAIDPRTETEDTAARLSRVLVAIDIRTSYREATPCPPAEETCAAALFGRPDFWCIYPTHGTTDATPVYTSFFRLYDLDPNTDYILRIYSSLGSAPEGSWLLTLGGCVGGEFVASEVFHDPGFVDLPFNSGDHDRAIITISGARSSDPDGSIDLRIETA